MNEVDVAYKLFMYPVLSSMLYLSTCKFLGSFRHKLNGLYKHNQYYKCAIKSLGAIYNLIMTIYSGATFFLLYRALLSDYGAVLDYSSWLKSHLIDSHEVALKTRRTKTGTPTHRSMAKTPPNLQIKSMAIPRRMASRTHL